MKDDVMYQKVPFQVILEFIEKSRVSIFPYYYAIYLLY